MENRVYYGEYSLEHWIKLILKGNIKLPEYQRSFCWDISDVTSLIDSLKNKRFVPPITIGAFKMNDKNENYIIDGQQRLTSILLASLGKFPNKNQISVIKNNDDVVVEEDKEVEITENDQDRDLRWIKWTMKDLTDKGNTKEKIIQKLDNNHYVNLKQVDDNFLKNHFLGFSYIVPNAVNDIEQQEFYSSVFRDINIKGRGLTPSESRRSFYFLDANFKDFFEPTFINRLLKENGNNIDFIRYLSLLFDKNRLNIAYGFSGRKERNRNTKRTLEDFYLEFIYETIGKKDSKIFKKYSDVFNDESVKKSQNNQESQESQDKPRIEDIKNERFRILENTINEFIGEKNFSSFTECDIYMFGLVEKIILQGKRIDLSNKEELKLHLNKENTELRKKYDRVSRTSLSYIRECVNKSIEIYDKYEAQQPQ